MYHIKADRRSLRSCKMIYDGLAALMQNKPFDSITVTDLVEKAKVGRTTFYRYFDQIEDVLRMRCDQVAAELIDYLVENRPADMPVRTAILESILRYFHLHSEVIELLMKANRVYIFEEALYRYFVSFKTSFSEFYGVEDEYVDYIMLARIGSLANVLTHWVATGKQQAPDALAHRLRVVLSDMIALEHWL